MTDEQLDAIEARANGATPGPWVRVGGSRVNTTVEGELDADEVACSVQSSEDAAFIAAARSDVPTLVAEVRLLRRILADLQVDSEAYRRGVEDGRREGFEAGQQEVHRQLYAQQVLESVRRGRVPGGSPPPPRFAQP